MHITSFPMLRVKVALTTRLGDQFGLRGQKPHMHKNDRSTRAYCAKPARWEDSINAAYAVGSEQLENLGGAVRQIFRHSPRAQLALHQIRSGDGYHRVGARRTRCFGCVGSPLQDMARIRRERCGYWVAEIWAGWRSDRGTPNYDRTP